MRIAKNLTLSVLLAATAVVVVGLFLTRGSRPTSTANGNGSAPGAPQALVDERPLETARSLQPLASTPDERQLAQQAMHLADQEVDLAFTIALRTASQMTATQSPAVKAAQDRLQKAEAEADAGDARVKQLTAVDSQAKGSKKDRLDQQLQLAQAELELDQDQVEGAKAELSRAGGDRRSEIQRQWQQHEQAHPSDSGPQPGGGGNLSSSFQSDSLIAKWEFWRAQRAKRAQLLEALAAVHRLSSTLALEHDRLAQQVQAEQSQKRSQAQQAATLLDAQKPNAPAPGQAAADAVSGLRQVSTNSKNLSDTVKRLQGLNQLSTIYWRWSKLVGADVQAALHSLLGSALWIVLIILLAFLISSVVDRSLARLHYDNKRVLTLHTVAGFTVRVVAGLAILLVIFGLPSNLSTALGLAGAGLTVALKDFILSFCGWFVLMGRHGIRVGDWVEINGVRGEVAEIGLLRTVLLETGNWTDPGHPTGRQVAFPNSFAVEGYYFNFSTTGQWLWDETQLHIPGGVDPYPIIEQIQATAKKETEANARRAEEEWKRVTRRYGVRTFSSDPAVNVKPTGDGVDVVVRYITSAQERYEVRARLNHAVLELIHRRKPSAGAETAPRSATVASGSAT